MGTLTIKTKHLLWALGLIAVLVVLATLTATGVFAHGGNAKLIHACVNKSSGTVKIVGPNDTCKRNWLAVNWNIKGEKGDKGDQGEKGDKGDPGTPGLQGAPGINCWDQDGNGVGDLPTDDTNVDGVVDVLDCQGPEGATDVLENIVFNFDHDGDTFSFNDGDCDDANSTVFPGALEVADGLDNDCDGIVDNPELIDSDGDRQKWLRKSEQGDKWNRCLIEGMIVLSETGARDEQTTPP